MARDSLAFEVALRRPDTSPIIFVGVLGCRPPFFGRCEAAEEKGGENEVGHWSRRKLLKTGSEEVLQGYTVRRRLSLSSQLEPTPNLDAFCGSSSVGQGDYVVNKRQQHHHQTGGVYWRQTAGFAVAKLPTCL